VHARLGAYPFTAFSRSALLYLFGHKKLTTQWKISQMNLLMSIQLSITRDEALATHRHSRVQDTLIPITGRAPLYRLLFRNARSGLKAPPNDTNLQTECRFVRYSITASLLNTYDECMRLPAAAQEEVLESHDDDEEVEDRPTDWPGDRDMRLRAKQLAARFRLQERKQLLEDIERTKSTVMLSVFQVTSKWRKHVLFQLESGAATSAFLAVLLGSSYLAPMARHRQSDSLSSLYLERVCHCGLKATAIPEDLDLHFFDCFATRCCTRGTTVRRDHLKAASGSVHFLVYLGFFLLLLDLHLACN